VNASLRAGRPGRELIEDIGRALALGAVLLPVAGVLIRYLAFWIGHTVDHPLNLALAESPGILIALGFDSLLIGLLVLPFIALWSYISPAQHHSDRVADFRRRFEDFKARNAEVADEEVPRELIDELTVLESDLSRLEANAAELPKLPRLLPDRVTRFLSRHERPLSQVWLTSQVIYWGGLFLFGPFPYALSATGLLIAQLFLPRVGRRTGRISLGQVWPLVVAVLLIAAVGAGLERVLLPMIGFGIQTAPDRGVSTRGEFQYFAGPAHQRRNARVLLGIVIRIR